MLFALFRTPRSIALSLAVIVVASCLFLMSSSVRAGTPEKPAYDLIFGVFTFDPNLRSAVTMSPYLIDGTLYLDAEKLTARQGTISSWVQLYRYHCKTGIAEPLPTPTAHEMQHLEGKQQVVFRPTEHLKLDTNPTSPDGYSLAEPNWVKVNPLSNVLGNIALFFFSGGFEQLTKRETTPRLAKKPLSLPMKSKRPLFQNDAENAFFLGWVVPASPAAADQKR